METITLQFNPNSSFAQALLNLIKVSGEVTVVETKTAKPSRKRTSKKERLLAEIAKGADEARRMASKPHKTYTAEEIAEAI